MMNNAPIIDPDQGQTGSGLSPVELDEVRARRASLRRAGAQVRKALTTPGPDGAPARAGAVLAAVTDLAHVWSTHTSVTESPDGMLEQILADSARMAPAVLRLRAEHATVATALDAVRRQLVAAPPDGEVDATTTAPALAKVLDAVDRHRKEGRELIYHAYQVDLGLGE